MPNQIRILNNNRICTFFFIRISISKTKTFLEAIAREDWASACRATLDYYDRCYDHELARTPRREAIDLSGLSADEAAEKLINRGFIEIPD